MNVASIIRTFIVCCCAGFIWAWILPMWLGPDETAHFSYVQYMVYHNRPPKVQYVPPGRLPWFSGASLSTLRARASMHTGFIVQNPAHYLHPTERQRNQVLVELNRISTLHENTPLSQNYVGIYPPLYYGSIGKLLRLCGVHNVINQAYLARIFSSFILGLFGVLCWFLLKPVLPNRTTRETVVVAVPLLFPTLSMLGGAVNNDVLMDTCCVGLFMVIADAMRRSEWSWRAAILYGAAIGLSFVTKPSTYVLIAVTGLIVLYRLVRTGAIRTARFWTFGGVSAGVVAVLSLPWALVSYRYYHSLVPPLTYQATGNWPRTINWYLGHLLFSPKYQMDIMVYQTVSGVNFPWWVQPIKLQWFYNAWIVVVACLLIFGLWQLYRSSKGMFLVSLIWVGAVFTFLWYTTYTYLLHTGTHFLQGRYFFALLPVVIYLMAFALRGSRGLPGILLLASATVYVTVLDATVHRFYNRDLLSMALGNVVTYNPILIIICGSTALVALCLYVVWRVLRPAVAE